MPPQSILSQCVSDYFIRGLDKCLDLGLTRCTTEEQCIFGPYYYPTTGKTKHPHQRRIPNRILKDFLNKVTSMQHPTGGYPDFDAFFDAVSAHTGMKSLLVYDYCLRKGVSFGLEPNKNVYLFRGAKEGYKYFSGLLSAPYRINLTTLLNNPVFKPFTGVKSKYIEDILCAYKKGFPISVAKQPCSTIGFNPTICNWFPKP